MKTTYVCFTEYDMTIENKQVVFVKEEITNTFGEFLAANVLKQACMTETEKYAHVTFFFNSGVKEPNVGEDRILVKSSKVATYNLCDSWWKRSSLINMMSSSSTSRIRIWSDTQELRRLPSKQARQLMSA